MPAANQPLPEAVKRPAETGQFAEHGEHERHRHPEDQQDRERAPVVLEEAHEPRRGCSADLRGRDRRIRIAAPEPITAETVAVRLPSLTGVRITPGRVRLRVHSRPR